MKLIDHPHCIKLLDVYKSSSHIYMVLELMSGGELFDRIIAKASALPHHHTRTFVFNTNIVPQIPRPTLTPAKKQEHYSETEAAQCFVQVHTALSPPSLPANHSLDRPRLGCGKVDAHTEVATGEFGTGSCSCPRPVRDRTACMHLSSGPANR
jgi:serine/threonine protein kinase